jgi:hypothetical protein
MGWCPFPWRVLGCAKLAYGDLVVDDVLICALGTETFALVKRPAAMTECEWGELVDNAVALVREADPEAFAGMTGLLGAGR